MRICLVAHGFPPNECTGVEGYTNALATALVAEGHVVEVFAPRKESSLPNLSMRREERNGFGITWITTNVDPANPQEMLDLPGVAIRFGDHLDREMPEVIHFQHLVKLGLGLLEKAKERNIPSVYTAHDYYSVCHRVTLIRPDMQRCDQIGAPAICARCDLALAHLNGIEQLGDYQLGAFERQLDPLQWQQLTGILDGTPGAAGFSEEDQAELARKRTLLDQRRLEVYSTFDLILSPTRFLRDRLVEGGLPAKKIKLLTYGAETRDLANLPRAAHRPGQPLRFGYLGGLAKQKGVHVLLEAFGGLEGKATLSVWGASSDKAYVNDLKEQAKQVGANWMGDFSRPQLSAVLEQLDVVVVPSIWVENFPFVIREALAAGRPVITSDVGALPESVKAEHDGLLFAPGDAQALRVAMERFIQEPDLLGKLVEGAEPIKSIGEQVQELVPIYLRLISSHIKRHSPDLPRNLHKWAERYAELSSLPQRDLFRRVLNNLTHMRRTLRGGDEKRARSILPSDALADFSKAQMLLRDLKRERVWLKSSVEEHEQSDKSLRERVSWREEELNSSKKEVLWLNKTVAQREEESHWLKENLQQKESENNWLRDTLRGNEAELQWLRQSIDQKSEEADWLRKTAEDADELRIAIKEADALRKAAEDEQLAKQGRLEKLEERLASAKRQQELANDLYSGDKARLAASERALDQSRQAFEQETIKLRREICRAQELEEQLIAFAEQADAGFFAKRSLLGRELIQWLQEHLKETEEGTQQ